MSINLEALAKEAGAISWREAYNFERPAVHEKEDKRDKTFALAVALRVIEQIVREIGTVPVQAPDAQIVKDKISGRLRAIALELRNAREVNR